jgi:hypothetical protein
VIIKEAEKNVVLSEIYHQYIYTVAKMMVGKQIFIMFNRKHENSFKSD